MKTVSQLGTGKMPVGTIAYMGRVEYLMQCRSDAQNGTFILESIKKKYEILFSFKCISQLIYKPWVEYE